MNIQLWCRYVISPECGKVLYSYLHLFFIGKQTVLGFQLGERRLVFVYIQRSLWSIIFVDVGRYMLIAVSLLLFSIYIVIHLTCMFPNVFIKYSNK